jgi:PhzF family phenazine biosynthesis protein
MSVPIYQVDAFTSEPFKGNPAAVCLLESTRPEGWMQNVAAEMNLSETAFLVPEEDGFALRWFTPTVEVPLCGHATLASAHVLWETGRVRHDEAAGFYTKSGRLQATRSDAGIEINLPSIGQEEAEPPANAVKAVGVHPRYCGRTKERSGGDIDFFFVLDSESQVRRLEPDFNALKSLEAGLIATAPADPGSCDFVSRYFAPFWGIDEDPVTGAAHCSLVPFWSQKLDKSEVLGYQASARGGYVQGRVLGDRVALVGQAVTVFRGELQDQPGARATRSSDLRPEEL